MAVYAIGGDAISVFNATEPSAVPSFIGSNGAKVAFPSVNLGGDVMQVALGGRHTCVVVREDKYRVKCFGT